MTVPAVTGENHKYREFLTGTRSRIANHYTAALIAVAIFFVCKDTLLYIFL